VRGYDPAVPGGAANTASAVEGADVVLSVNAAKVAVEVAGDAVGALGERTVFADLNTAAPALKRELAALVGSRFADVALLGPVPAKGIATPALASGLGAQAFADTLGPFGMPVQVVSADAGDAAAMKLVRSVFMKGLAASAVESVEAAEAAGCGEWLKDEIAAVIGRPMLDRVLEGSRQHAARRVDEMEAARELLRELGVEPRIAAASAALLADLAEDAK
jgi:3-hydroxyisobutyrate dehydrogenase-like beta-hydroxyacid dehydrogenase